MKKFKQNKFKVLTIVGTRPEIIRLSRVISILNKECDHVLVHTGQNYDFELNEIFFKDLGIKKPDFFLNASGKNAAETIANIILQVDKILDKINPQAVLILGDTNSALSAISVKKRKIPLFHMEAGNRCFDERVPEEINRKIVDHIADINLTYSEISKNYLLREGVHPQSIIKIGSPMLEVLDFYRKKINSSKILSLLKLKRHYFCLVSIHREENIDSPVAFNKIKKILNAIAEKYNFDVIVSTHPRTRKKLNEEKFIFNKKIRFIDPLNFTDYNKLQISSKFVVSDSGTIVEESSIMNFPALNLREVTERPEGMEEASVIMSGLDFETVLQSLAVLENQMRGDKRSFNIVDDYNVSNVSEKILRIILSYTGFINRTTWKKY